MTYRETSATAHQSIKATRESVDSRILDALSQRRMTCDEVEQDLGLLHQTASAELYHLEKRGLAVRTRDKRTTRTGRPAFIWAKA